SRSRSSGPEAIWSHHAVMKILGQDAGAAGYPKMNRYAGAPASHRAPVSLNAGPQYPDVMNNLPGAPQRPGYWTKSCPLRGRVLPPTFTSAPDGRCIPPGHLVRPPLQVSCRMVGTPTDAARGSLVWLPTA